MSGFVCPVPLSATETVLLGHGSGGKLSSELLHSVFLPAFDNPLLERLEDQAVLEFGGARLAFTTDSFVAKPLFFRGGDIGSLAVHGTVNDLAMCGARPVALSVAFILEEGFPIGNLGRIADSMARAASIGNMKQVWTNDGHEYDWFNPAQAEGRWFLQHATQVKNIWVPYGE